MSADLDPLIHAPRVSTPAGEVARCIGARDGRTEWERFASATRAAAAGGVTTIKIDLAEEPRGRLLGRGTA